MRGGGRLVGDGKRDAPATLGRPGRAGQGRTPHDANGAADRVVRRPACRLPAPRLRRAYFRTAVPTGFSVRSRNAHTRFQLSICSGESSFSSVCRFTRRLNVCPTLTGPGVGFQ